MWKHFLLGSVSTILALFVLGYLLAAMGAIPANADAQPPAWEKWIARTALRAAIRRNAPVDPNPIPVTDENLIKGIKIYGDNCAICHGALDAKPSNIATGLYQKAPQFAKHGVEDDPEGQTFWIIKHGVRLTGMPAFTDMTDEQIWLITLFLKSMDALPPKAQKAWQEVPSAALP